MRPSRLAVAIVAAAALVPLTATVASAAPPANDKPEGAITLTLGDTIQEDTTKATTGSLDAKVNQFCGAPYTNASVWFTYTPTTSGGFILDSSASDFSTGLMAFRGAPTGRSLRACGPDSIAFKAMAGTTYTIMAFSPTPQNGGNLQLSLEEAPPAPTVDVTVNPTGRAFPNGNALVGGTYACTNADYIDIYGELLQIWQRVKITGFFDRFVEGTCDGETHAWQRIVTSDNGLFAGGEATVSATGQACGVLECKNSRLDDVTITLKEGSGSPAGVGRAAEASSLPQADTCATHSGQSLYTTRSACQAAFLVASR